MQIIGICGLKWSGKNTVGKILCELLPNAKCFSFADKLKDVVSVLFNWDRKMLEGDSIESREWRETVDSFWNITPRSALQKIGTDVLRKHFRDSIWIDSLNKNINDNKDIEYAIITDCRFENEIKFIKDNNGIILEVQKDVVPDWYNIAKELNSNESELIRTYSIPKELEDIHESEWRWIGKEDFIIKNDGISIENLTNNIKEKLNEIYKS